MSAELNLDFPDKGHVSVHFAGTESGALEFANPLTTKTTRKSIGTSKSMRPAGTMNRTTSKLGASQTNYPFGVKRSLTLCSATARLHVFSTPFRTKERRRGYYDPR